MLTSTIEIILSPMGWRFRRSIKIAPGIRWNLSKRGSSFSFGRRGFTVNVGPRGVRRTISIPGTGLSHTQQLTSHRGRPSVARTSAELSAPTTDAAPPTFSVPLNTLVPFTDEAAGTAARRWAIVNYNLVGRTLTPSQVTRSDVRSTEVAYHIRFRQVVVRTEPISRKTIPEISFPRGSDFDPWADDILEQLPPRRLVAECHDCEGNGQRGCPRCNGTVRVTCDACGGSGDEWSMRSGRLIRCGKCKGKGQRACPCRDGLIPCTTCNAKGVVRAWLEVEEGTRDIVKTHADDGSEIEAGPDKPNVELALEWTGDPSKPPENATTLLTEEPLRYTPDQRTERIERISIKQLRSEKATVRFEGTGTHGDVDVQAWTGEVHRTGSSDLPFLRAKRRLRLAWVATFIASVVLLGWFTSRHRYYAESAEAGYLALLALALPIAATWPVLRAQRGSHSGVGLLFTSIPLLCVVGAQAVFAAGGPSVKRAEELRAAGRLDGSSIMN